MTNPTIHVWITKYALTEGIQETDAEHCISVSKRMIVCPGLGPFAVFHREGGEWHRTRESAVAKADKMRLDRIRSLKKSIKKLEALTFE